MQDRKLGAADLTVSEIGFGCWAMGKWMWGDDVVDEESVKAVHRGLELGITLFDTAAVYGFGHSERVLARALGSRRQDIVLATKCGLRWDDRENIWRDSSPQSIVQECEDSLQRLNTDVIDLYQVHWPDDDTPFEDTMAALVSLQEQGKIRAIGVSNFSVEQMQRLRSAGPLVSDQPPYSLLRRGIEKDVLPFCRENGLGVLCYSPMQRGLLTGKYQPGVAFPESDGRHNDRLFQGDTFLRIHSAVEKLRALAAESGKTPAQMALAWVLNQPGVTVALCGVKRPAHIEESAGAAGWKLDADLLARIESLFEGLP